MRQPQGVKAVAIAQRHRRECRLSSTSELTSTPEDWLEIWTYTLGTSPGVPLRLSVISTVNRRLALERHGHGDAEAEKTGSAKAVDTLAATEYRDQRNPLYLQRQRTRSSEYSRSVGAASGSVAAQAYQPMLLTSDPVADCRVYFTA